MPDFTQGKIYKITSNDMVYFGSTTETLDRRMSKHRTNYKLWLCGKNRKCSVFKMLQNGPCKIELVELCCCTTLNELLARERHYILSFPCINKNIPLRTSSEWAKDTDYINSEKQQQYRSQHTNCECGGSYYILDKAKHLKSARHIQFIDTGKKSDYSECVTICECGGKYGPTNKNKHMITKKHLAYVKRE